MSYRIEKNRDKPIYPFKDKEIDDGGDLYKSEQYVGLTKREYFAAMAMQGILASANTIAGHNPNWVNVASNAVTHADELLKALEKQGNK